MEPLLELRDVTVRYGRSVIFEHVSMSIGRGEFFLVHGNTGSGKSTLLKLLAGLERPSSGTIIVAGDHIERFNEMQRRWLRRSMGMMVQEGLLLEDRTVHENIMLPTLAAEESYAEARSRALLALQKCGIAELANHFPRQLSTGERQLANLARAVVNRPVVILADEPVAHLDHKNTARLLELLGTFVRAGVTVVCASHDPIAPEGVRARSIEL